MFTPWRAVGIPIAPHNEEGQGLWRDNHLSHQCNGACFDTLRLVGERAGDEALTDAGGSGDQAVQVFA